MLKIKVWAGQLGLCLVCKMAIFSLCPHVVVPLCVLP